MTSSKEQEQEAGRPTVSRQKAMLGVWAAGCVPDPSFSSMLFECGEAASVEEFHLFLVRSHCHVFLGWRRLHCILES